MIKIKKIDYFRNGETRETLHYFTDGEQFKDYLNNMKRLIQTDEDRVDAFIRKDVNNIFYPSSNDDVYSTLFVYDNSIDDDEMYYAINRLMDKNTKAFVKALIRIENNFESPKDDDIIEELYEHYIETDGVTLLHEDLMTQ